MHTQAEQLKAQTDAYFGVPVLRPFDIERDLGSAEIEVSGFSTRASTYIREDYHGNAHASVRLGESLLVDAEAEGFETLNLSASSAQYSKFEADDVDHFNLWSGDATGSQAFLDDVGGGRVNLGGDRIDFEAVDSKLDELRGEGFGNEFFLLGSDVGKLNAGAMADVRAIGSQVRDFDTGPFSDVTAFHSFVSGELGFGSTANLQNSRSILELEGFNRVEASGGQMIVNAGNHQLDTFKFNNMKVDGTFDEYDQIQMASGAAWSAGELFGDAPVQELPGEVNIAGFLHDDSYDSGAVFDGRG